MDCSRRAGLREKGANLSSRFGVLSDNSGAKEGEEA
jgi:hypothetical protein